MTRDIVLCICVMPACSVSLHLTIPADCLVRVYGSKPLVIGASTDGGLA